MKTGILSRQDGKENPTNLLTNGDFELWSSGASVAPDGWTLDGSGATVAREQSTIKIGTYSAKLISSTNNPAELYQYFNATRGINYFKGRTVTFGVWVWASVANKVSIFISDSVNGTQSSYHPGDSAWHFLTVTRTIDINATDVRCVIYGASTSSITFYFDGAICVEGESVFAFSPSPKDTIYTRSFIITNPTATADAPLWRVPYAITITGIHLLCKGAAIVGQLWEYDSNGLNGSTVDADITGVVDTNVNDDGSLSNPGIASGNYLGWKTTSATVGATQAIVSFEYTING